MSENWKAQVSLKFGPAGCHMLNLRADTMAELSELLSSLVDGQEAILNAAGAFAPSGHVASASGGGATARGGVSLVSDTQPPPMASSASQSEMGPIEIMGVAIKDGVGKESGKPFTVYEVDFGAFKASTFDALLGDIARKARGQKVYAVIEQKGKYKNVKGLRMAS